MTPPGALAVPNCQSRQVQERQDLRNEMCLHSATTPWCASSAPKLPMKCAETRCLQCERGEEIEDEPNGVRSHDHQHVVLR